MFALNWSIKSSIFGEYLFMRLEKIKNIELSLSSYLFQLVF